MAQASEIVNFARTEEKTDKHKKRWQKDNFMTNRSRNERLTDEQRRTDEFWKNYYKNLKVNDAA